MSDTERLIEEAGRLLGGLRGVRWDNLPACDPRDLFALDAGGAGPLHVATIHAGEDETLFVKESPRLVADLVTALRAQRERADRATVSALELRQRMRALELVSTAAIRRHDEIAAELRAERDAARAELARLTTPRPIAEAPRDGTWVKIHWSVQQYPYLRSVRWAVARYAPDCFVWVDERQEPLLEPTHYLPLPAEGGQRAEKVLS